MAKQRRGGSRQTVIQPTPIPPTPTIQQTAQTPPPQVTPPTPQNVQQGNVLPQGGVPFNQFQSMTDDQKAQVISDALKTQTPLFLDKSDLQKLAYFTGLSNKPQLMDDSALDAIKGTGLTGTDLYRTVSDTYNPSTDIGYSAKDICDQIINGDFTMYSDSGGSAYGKAIYASDSYSGSAAYGRGAKSLTMRMKIVDGSRFVSQSKLQSMLSSEMSSGSKLGKVLRSVDPSSRLGVLALAKGIAGSYDGYTSAGNDRYYMIYDRSALAASKDLKQSSYGSNWKKSQTKYTLK